MSDKSHRKTSFVDQMHAQLVQYQIQKIKREDNRCLLKNQNHQKEVQAKATLIDMDNENQFSKISSEDIYIGRWANYKVPEKIEERISLSKKTRKNTIQKTQFFKYNPEFQRQNCHYYCRSEKVIPKLKVILHQLQQPLNLPQKKVSQESKKFKNYIGIQALVISNKQQIKPSAKSQRKLAPTLGSALKGIQNKRPSSNNPSLKKQIVESNNYQKIKRNFGFNNQDCDVLYQKEILSQLLKANTSNKQPPQINPLTNMLNNYFTISTNDKKKNTQIKLGLDKLLS